jgi:uncharacterized membrane protein YeaQ/YmgE (transglycosylase-associated protein family)
MEILLWVVLGGVAGWISSVIMKTDARQGLLGDIILGILGAVVGGFIFGLFGAAPATGLNFYSLFVAIVGAVVLIWLGRVFTRAV